MRRSWCLEGDLSVAQKLPQFLYNKSCTSLRAVTLLRIDYGINGGYGQVLPELPHLGIFVSYCNPTTYNRFEVSGTACK